MTIRIAKNLIKSLILAFVFTISTQSAFCYTLTKDEINKSLVRKISYETKKLAPDAEIKVTILSGLPNSNILTKDNKKPTFELSNLQGFHPMGYRRVVIRDSQNNIIQMFNINVQTKLYQQVLVAQEDIAFGFELNSNNTKIEKREITKYFGKTLNSLDSEYVANKNIQKDTVILNNAIKKKALVSKNSNVDIVFLSKSGLMITLQGKALKEGALGDTILVRSDKYNKTYSATVESSRKVTVRI